MSEDLTKIIVAICLTIPSIVFGFIFFGKRLPSFKHPFLWGLVILLIIIGSIVGFLFLNIWAGLVIASISLPIYFMYMWYGTKAITQRWNNDMEQASKEHETKKEIKDKRKRR